LELVQKSNFNARTKKSYSVLDGSNYSSLIKSTDSRKILVSLGLNSDGAPLVVDTNVSMWPVLAKIIELPVLIGESFKNLVFVGMWLCNSKPIYDKFLEKCVNRVVEAQNDNSNLTKSKFI
jgi:ribosomal protein L30/L7E